MTLIRALEITLSLGFMFAVLFVHLWLFRVFFVHLERAKGVVETLLCFGYLAVVIFGILMTSEYTLSGMKYASDVTSEGKAAADLHQQEEKLPEPYRINTRQEIVRFKLVQMNPPKHFYVHLERDGVVTKHHVSKHCNNYRDNKLGDEYNIRVQFYKMSNGTKEYMELKDLYNVFC